LSGLQGLGFVALFVIAWLSITSLLAAFAGHFTLVGRFPPAEDDRIEQTYYMASGYMGIVSFGNALTVKFGVRGLHLGAMILFRPIYSRRLPCIPWSEIEQVRTSSGLLASWFFGPKFRIRSEGRTFTLNGGPGLALQERLKRVPPAS